MENIKEEQPVVVDNITTALTKANVTEQILTELKSYKSLTINGIDDKKGYEEVYKARQRAKNTRVLAVKICVKGREEAIAEQRRWVAKEKEITSQIEEVEAHLKSEEDRIDAEKERLKQEAIRKEQERLHARVKQLLDLGMAFTGSAYVLEGNVVDSVTLNKMTDTEFEKFIEVVTPFAEAAKAREEEQKRLQQEEQERLRLVAEEQERERIRLAEENRKLLEEQARIKEEQEKEAERLRLAQLKFQQEQEAEAARLRQIHLDNLRDREVLRCSKLASLGMIADNILDKYHLAGAGSISFTDIYQLNDKDWSTRLAIIEDQVNNKKIELQEIREKELEAAKQQAIKDEQERVRKEEEARIEQERIAKEQEIERINSMSDKELMESLSESVVKLADELSSYTPKSKAYQTKLAASVKILINTAKAMRD